MQVQAEFLAGGADRLQLVRAVHRTDLGGLGESHHARLRIVDILALESDVADRRRGQLADLGLRQQQLGAVGEELRRAALVGLDVGGLRADHAVVALAQRGQGQGVGGGAVEGEEHFAIGLEQLAEVVRSARGPLVVAIGALVAAVGFGHRRPGFGADTGIVVAGELLGVIGHVGLWNGCRALVGLHAVVPARIRAGTVCQGSLVSFICSTNGTSTWRIAVALPPLGVSRVLRVST